MAAPETKELVRRFVHELWDDGDETALERYLTPDLKEVVRVHHRELVDAFSDLRVVVDEPGLVAEGDLVVARLVIRGIHDRGAFAGRPPTGRTIAWTSIRIYRIENGRIAQSWAMQDRLGLLQQVGAVPAPDTSVHWADAGT